jgi:hypothetical protein
MKILTPILFLYLLVSISCNKLQDLQEPDQPLGPHKIKIEISGGNNQSDTIGNELKDSIIIKLSRADTLLKNYAITFFESSCFSSISKMRWTSEQGISKFAWRLNNIKGTQRLKVTLYDSVLKVHDSVFVIAEGKAPDSAWLPGDCLPPAQVNTFAQLSSGRILCGLHMDIKPFFSDNDGQSWQQISSFPGNYSAKKIAVSSNNEIYIATQNNGIFYSNDNGDSWQPRSTGITDARSLVDFSILRSGKLMASTYFGGLYISEDKGHSWTSLSVSPFNNDRYSNFNESKSGNLYILSDVYRLWKSSDNGKTWNIEKNVPYSYVQSIFIDDNDDMYIGSNYYNTYILKSTDAGESWTIKYTSPIPPPASDDILRISKSYGYYYFTVNGYGLIRTKDFILFDNIFPFASEYLIHSNGTILISNYRTPVLYNRYP